MNELLADLNPKQKEAVLTTGGPVLILAGPGSGKTKTLTHRIAYLMETGVAAENILAVTFTNKAAEEMRSRVYTLQTAHGKEQHKTASQEYPLPASLPFIGTFHSFAVKILRAHAQKIGYLKNFTICGEDDSLSLVKEVMKELEINPKQFPAGMIMHVVSGLKSELKTPEQYADETGTADLFPKTVHAIYTEYQRRLKEANAMDFDDLLTNTHTLFEQHPEILARYQDQFRYINVDEYQDVNTAQYRIILLLAKKHRNVAVVGDDAQAIYGWRGADFRNILNFEKDWPDARVVVLDQNYRSTQTILNAAQGVIAKNHLQKQKNLWSEQKGGELISLTAVANERAEAEFVFSNIQDALRHGKTLKDIAILYRTNAQSRAFEEIFLEHNFPYQIIGWVRFYQRKEVKDILAYIRYLLNEKDLLSLKRIINVPPRGIGKSTLLAHLSESNMGMRHGEAEKLGSFKTLIQELQQTCTQENATMFVKKILKVIRYKEYLGDSSPNADERWENVEELVNLAGRYDTLPPPQGLAQLLEDVALMSDTDHMHQNREAIPLMTFHAAKGLEFPMIFMVGMEEGVFPHSRSLFNPQELEEERRLCYVGLTRAKKQVHLSFALRRAHFGSIQANAPSRFLSEIPEHLIEVKENLDTIEI